MFNQTQKQNNDELWPPVIEIKIPGYNRVLFSNTRIQNEHQFISENRNELFWTEIVEPGSMKRKDLKNTLNVLRVFKGQGSEK